MPGRHRLTSNPQMTGVYNGNYLQHFNFGTGLCNKFRHGNEALEASKNVPASEAVDRLGDPLRTLG